MLTQLLDKPCRIVQRYDTGSTDDLGNPDIDETITHTVCEIQQARRTEGDLEGELSDTRWTIWFPAGTEVQTDDAVEVGGFVYELVGGPADWEHTMSPGMEHVEASARRTGTAEDPS